MKKIFTFTIILLALIACTVAVRASIGYFSVTQATSDSTATDILLGNMPNPASVYCEQNGNTLEIRTADDGGQNGVCIFPDGSTCDEWAYFRGECGPAGSGGGPGGSGGAEENGWGSYMPPGTTEEIADWWGIIKSTGIGAQYDDYFVRQDLGQIIYFSLPYINNLGLRLKPK